MIPLDALLISKCFLRINSGKNQYSLTPASPESQTPLGLFPFLFFLFWFTSLQMDQAIFFFLLPVTQRWFISSLFCIISIVILFSWILSISYNSWSLDFPSQVTFNCFRNMIKFEYCLYKMKLQIYECVTHSGWQISWYQAPISCLLLSFTLLQLNRHH